MKQLGNLAIVCAQRSDVLLEIHGGLVSIHMGQNIFHTFEAPLRKHTAVLSFCCTPVDKIYRPGHHFHH